jgi:hypothetical protein
MIAHRHEKRKTIMPNVIFLAIALIVCLAITQSSAKKDEQKTREQIAHMDHQPKPAMVQGEASGGAWLLGIIIAIVAVVLAMPR